MKLWFTRGVWVSGNARSKAAALSIASVRKIAVIRHAALGDMVLTRSFLVELKKAFPNAKITLSVASHYMRGTPDDLVDRIHIVHGTDQRRAKFGEKYARFKELGRQDIIFDLAATPRSFLTCVLNKATLKIGFPYREMQRRLFYDIAVPRSDLNFEVDDMMSQLHSLGVRTRYPHRFNMPGIPIRRNRPFLIFFTGASTPAKCWPEDHFSKLIDRLSADYPALDHLLLKGINPWESGESIIRPLIDRPNVATVEADTIEETVNLLLGASLVIANDTGIRNLAIVCEVPTVGIFFATDPYRYWPRHSGMHEIVLLADGGVPTVDDLYASCTRILSGETVN